jgi:ribosomal protein L24
VIAGKDKGKTGTDSRNSYETLTRSLIEGSQCREATPERIKSHLVHKDKIIEKSMPLHVSNVCAQSRATRQSVPDTSFEGEGEKRKKVRVSKATGKKI